MHLGRFHKENMDGCSTVVLLRVGWDGMGWDGMEWNGMGLDGLRGIV